jgi:hypothetical protein
VLLADSNTGSAHFTGNIAFAENGGNLTTAQEAMFYARVHTCLQTIAGAPQQSTV